MQCMYTDICVCVHIRVYACTLEDQHFSGTFHFVFFETGSLLCLQPPSGCPGSPGSACLCFPVMMKLHHIQMSHRVLLGSCAQATVFVSQALYQLNVFRLYHYVGFFSGIGPDRTGFVHSSTFFSLASFNW